jgi:hypothetical protein
LDAIASEMAGVQLSRSLMPHRHESRRWKLPAQRQAATHVIILSLNWMLAWGSELADDAMNP